MLTCADTLLVIVDIQEKLVRAMHARDDLIHIYETVEMDKPVFNPVWYRVFGGYMHRARLQKVRFQYNQVLEDLGGMRRVAELMK